MKSGEAQSMFDTRVQLSFKLNSAPWIPDDIKQKMKVVHKNRITKAGEFVVKCEATSNQKENERLALELIQQYIEEAEEAVRADEVLANRLHHTEHIKQKFIKEGREKELEKKEQAIRDQRARQKE